MISKWIHISIFIGILFGFACCGSHKTNQQQVVKDIQGYPIYSLLKNNKFLYYTKDGKKLIADVGEIEFTGGRDSLSAYLLTRYINHPNYNYREYNVYEYFFILFDENLDIKEIRIMGLKYADRTKFYYDIFIESLKNTIGMWYKKTENKKWYIYLHRQMIY